MTIIEMPQPLGLFAGQLFDRGIEYLEAFEVLSGDGVRKYHPSYFLCAHSLELFLKSYLAAKGVPKSKIRHRPKQHDLTALLEECNVLSLPDVTDLKDFASAIYSMNQDYDFRYPTNYDLSVPDPAICLRVLSSLREAILPTTRERIYAQLQFAADTRNDRGKQVRWSD
jgi:HEPN domain-containing protein